MALHYGPPTERVLFEACSTDAADPGGRKIAWVSSETEAGGRRGLWIADLADVAGTRRRVLNERRMGRPVWHPDAARFIVAAESTTPSQVVLLAIDPTAEAGSEVTDTSARLFQSVPLGGAYHVALRPGADEGGAAPAPVSVAIGGTLCEATVSAAGEIGPITDKALIVGAFPADDLDAVDPDGTDAASRLFVPHHGTENLNLIRAAGSSVGEHAGNVTGLDARRVAVLPGGDQGERLLALVRTATGGSLRRSTEPSAWGLDAMATEVAQLLRSDQALASWDGLLAAVVDAGRLYTLDPASGARALVAALDPAVTGLGADALYMALAATGAAGGEVVAVRFHPGAVTTNGGIVRYFEIGPNGGSPWALQNATASQSAQGTPASALVDDTGAWDFVSLPAHWRAELVTPADVAEGDVLAYTMKQQNGSYNWTAGYIALELSGGSEVYVSLESDAQGPTSPTVQTGTTTVGPLSGGDPAPEFRYWRLVFSANNGDASFGGTHTVDFFASPGAYRLGGTPTITTSSAVSSNTGAKTYDENGSSRWVVAVADFPAVITFDFGSAVEVAEYGVGPYANDNGSPTRNWAAWTLEGSDDGSTWTTVDTVSGETWSGNLGQVKRYLTS